MLDINRFPPVTEDYVTTVTCTHCAMQDFLLNLLPAMPDCRQILYTLLFVAYVLRSNERVQEVALEGAGDVLCAATVNGLVVC